MPTSRLSSRSDVCADSNAASTATLTSSIVGTVWVMVCVAVIVAMVCKSCSLLAENQVRAPDVVCRGVIYALPSPSSPCYRCKG